MLNDVNRTREHGGAREYAAITIGNCGANSEEGAETIVKHASIMGAIVSCLGNGRDTRMQETTVVALKNCAASSQEAAFLVSQSDDALQILKDLALQDANARLRDVVSGNSFLQRLYYQASRSRLEAYIAREQMRRLLGQSTAFLDLFALCLG